MELFNYVSSDSEREDETPDISSSTGSVLQAKQKSEVPLLSETLRLFRCQSRCIVVPLSLMYTHTYTLLPQNRQL